jgi:rhodanese-related sulfurtransferase
MGEPSEELQAALEQAGKAQEDLDRQVFFLKTLFDASTELAGLIQPGKILDSFLLTAMGALGIAPGLGGLLNTGTGQGHVIGRGMDTAELREAENNLPAICFGYFAEAAPAESQPPRIKVLTRESFGPYGLFPAWANILILWNLSADYGGFLALGEKISGRPLDEGDMDLLLNLTHVLTGALNHALSVLNIQQLNAELLTKNVELQGTLDALRSSRDELDRRIFHLGSLSDLNAELSPLFDFDRLLQSFLMTTMGSLGVGQGFVMVHDRESRSPHIATRGMVRSPHLDGDQCEALLYKAFEASEEKSFEPSSVCRVSDPSVFRGVGVTMDAQLGFFFVMDASFMGVVALGPTITSGSFSPDEVDLLTTHISNFIVFLRNARAFQTIQTLNEDLSRRNEELSRTIAELTEARHRITILERARARLRSLVQKEAERMGRASGFDCVLILLLATAVGVLFNFAAPQGISLVQESVLRPAVAGITPGAARRVMEKDGAILIDARPRELYDRQHIQGALNVPLSLFDVVYMMKLSQLDPARPVIVYGRTISRRYDDELAFRLKQRDHEDVKVLHGGLDGWGTQGVQAE